MYSAIVSAVFLGCSLFCPPVRPQGTCKTIKQSNPASGVRNISVGSDTVQAYCDQDTDGGGWTVIQRRHDGRVNFDRGWDDYKNGFGDLKRGYWLGLENIHRLTARDSVTLRVDLWAYNGAKAYARYGYFRLSDSSDSYRLLIGLYSGTAGDSLWPHFLQPFSTLTQHRAWWTIPTTHASCLNGRYYPFPGQPGKDLDGIFWLLFRGHESLMKTEMKIREW